MKIFFALFLMFVAVRIYAGVPESDIAAVVPGHWSIIMSDLIIFEKTGIAIQPDPMHQAEIQINADHTGTILTPRGPMTFTWKSSLNRLVITTPRMTMQFKIRQVNENQVMAVQEKASEPNISFVGILQRVVSTGPDAGSKKETTK